MMKLIVSLVLFFTTSAWASREVVVEIDSKVEVTSRPKLTWADIARVRGADQGFLRDLESLEWLGEGTSTVTAGARRLRARSGGRRLRVKLPQEIVVTKVEGFSIEEFRRKIENHLSILCSDCHLQWLPGLMPLPKIQADWRIDDSALKLRGQMVVPVLSSAGTAWLPVRLKIEKPGLVLTSHVTAGETVDATRAEIRYVDISNGHRRPLDPSVLGTVETSRGLPMGHDLQESDVRQPESVKRGQLVKLLGGGGDFEVVVQGLAEASGRNGDVIRVKNTESGRILSGRIVDTGVVRIE